MLFYYVLGPTYTNVVYVKGFLIPGCPFRGVLLNNMFI